MGNQKEYLNRVLERIIGETNYDDNYNVISPVMFSIKWYVVKNPKMLSSTPPAAFIEHCTDVYALTKEELQYVWEGYKTYIRNNKINESVDKQKEFLNNVLDRIVRETTIDYRGRGKIFTPFLPHHYPSHFSFHFSSYRSNFTKHCREVYGLNEQEIEYIWNIYKEIINDKISDHRYG